jgi:Fe-S-cluster-containing dehydrogenase component
VKITRREFVKLVTAGVGSLACPFAVKGIAGLSTGPVASNLKGKNWAMIVDLAACTEKDGCKDCIEACNRIHNVPHFTDPKRQIRWIWNSSYEELFPEQSAQVRPELRKRKILALCNHCENPPCVAVCPTEATFKRADGIVMMDYHRCIGCRYCMAACPYGARSFNWQDPRPLIQDVDINYPTRTKGVVEKCNFCEERLARGLIPACVEACKEKGLVFGDLNNKDSEVSKVLSKRYAMQRKPELGTRPKVFYLV